MDKKFRQTATALCTLMIFSIILCVVTQDANFEYLGSSQTKQFYLMHNDSLQQDFGNAIGRCRAYGMSLVAFENDEEFGVVSEYLTNTFGNRTEGFWTSATGLGDIPWSWATGGSVANMTGKPISTPWPAGGYNPVTWAWYNCLVVQRACKRPPGSPDGCWPAQTEYFIKPCTSPAKYICSKRILL